MTGFKGGSSAIAMAFASLAAATPAAAQQAITVRQGTTDTTPKTVGGADRVTVEAGGTLSAASNPAISWSTTSTDLRITNSGTIRTTASGGRAINASGGNNPRTVTLTNNAGAVIESQDDAFRINVAPSAGAVRVDNFGILRTTNGGQALDFDAVAGGATVVINNYAGAELRSFGQDGIRPGQNAVVTNAGLIYSDGPANNNYDGVDWQQKNGVVVNQATGTISGLRHGITSDVDVNVTNAGTILGRNGSGIGSDGTGTVVNTGTITGQWDGVATNGDGDGVDIDFIGAVINSGTIQGVSATGVDSGGRPNSAEGVAMGGGTIVNNAGATIFGAGNAVLINHDTNPGGVADGATTLTNAGTIRATTGRAVQFVGAFADTVTNSGTITGGTAGAIDMGAGDDTLNLVSGSVVTGAVDGGAGVDRVILSGTGAGLFAGAANFEALSVTGGTWSLNSALNFSGGTTVGAGAALTGTAGTLVGGIVAANGGRVIVDQAMAGTFAGTLVGGGMLMKTGAGALTVGNQTGFTGTAQVAAGQLILAGTLPAQVTVGNGASLAGTGTVAGLAAVTGATIAPGVGGVGTLTVTGAFSQAQNSIYAADVGAGGVSDRIAVGGAATLAPGAQLSVTRAAGSDTPGTRYTLLTAAGGVNGSYTLVQATGGTTELRLGQTGNAVYVDVARSALGLRGVGASPNQGAVANAVAAFGVANPIYAAITLLPTDAGVQAGLDTLSGEIHASLHTTMLKDAQAGEDAVRSRLLAPATTGLRIWGQGAGRSGRDDGEAGVASLDRRGWLGIGGVELGLEGARFGVAGGYGRTRVTSDARLSRATVKGTQLIGYAGGALGPVNIRTAVGYTWNDLEVRRGAGFPGFGANLAADYDGNVLHGFVEAGLPAPMLGGVVEPFVGVESYRVDTDAFTESGGVAALTGSNRRETFTLSTLGIRGETPITEGISARSRLGWRHVLGDVRPETDLRFSNGAVPFAVTGTPLSRDAAVVSLDLAWSPSENFTLTSGYSGAIGGRDDDNTLRVMLSLGF
ncbi:autotransporter outer membrane beta-barrel domain-containing protein [Sphingomonas aracearum]|uniref:Autotransporter domain-containing protein n=1 Tax=Sphingomonas aracearum TaxID=2283317 RepID=A0A369VZG0_9SPHN|nr:autotransporter domain-containing protein [Sphingomonas aracearum]RDE07189.1 autotransporter domain-containing protein [Sphingomonas aracearum]